jgi:DNA repair protein RadC
MPAKIEKPDDAPAEQPHYHGHRERLRERFRTSGPDALSDYELLEMALFAALPRRDTKPLAKSLLKKFGSFAEVMHAPEARLREVDGIGDASVNQLKLIAAAASRHRQGVSSSNAPRCRHGTTSSTIAAPAWRSPTRSSFACCFSTSAAG